MTLIISAFVILQFKKYLSDIKPSSVIGILWHETDIYKIDYISFSDSKFSFVKVFKLYVIFLFFIWKAEMDQQWSFTSIFDDLQRFEFFTQTQLPTFLNREILILKNCDALSLNVL